MNAVLFSCGCCGTAVSTIGAVPDSEEHSQITAWFPDVPSRDRALRQLEVLSVGPSGIRPTIEAGLQQDEDWLARWREGQQPFTIGQRLLVVPGEDDPPESLSLDRQVLRITPGMAFGTGHHETTRFCLEQLEAAAGSGTDFLDVGTGSGILAVAAVLLGCGKVVGTEIDPEAALVAAENIADHGFARRIQLLVTATPESVVGHAFPLVAANILGSTLMAMAPQLSGPLLAPGGRLLLAGILAGEEDRAVLETFLAQGLCCLERCVDGEWAGLVLEKPGS